MSATNRGAVRHPSDLYSTPLSAFTPLLPYLDKTKPHWEPAQGDGRLVKAMLEAGMVVGGSDITDITPVDFLEDKKGEEVIITNPPFSLAFEFCQHAVAHADEVFLLLRLNFLASQKRREWFKAHEPCALFVLSERPCFTENGKTDATDYCWMHWSKQPRHTGIFHL